MRYLLSALISLLLNVFVMLTCWFWALIPAVFKLTDLPGPLWYLQTHDDWVYGFGAPKPHAPASMWERWKIATWWLARNPGYGFDAYVLGFPHDDVATVATVGDWDDGIRTSFALKTGGKRFGYQRDLVYRAGGKRYCKIWLGWSQHVQGGAHMLKFDINPLKRKP